MPVTRAQQKRLAAGQNAFQAVTIEPEAQEPELPKLDLPTSDLSMSELSVSDILQPKAPALQTNTSLPTLPVKPDGVAREQGEEETTGPNMLGFETTTASPESGVEAIETAVASEGDGTASSSQPQSFIEKGKSEVSMKIGSACVNCVIIAIQKVEIHCRWKYRDRGRSCQRCECAGNDPKPCIKVPSQFQKRFAAFVPEFNKAVELVRKARDKFQAKQRRREFQKGWKPFRDALTAWYKKQVSAYKPSTNSSRQKPTEMMPHDPTQASSKAPKYGGKQRQQRMSAFGTGATRETDSTNDSLWTNSSYVQEVGAVEHQGSNRKNHSHGSLEVTDDSEGSSELEDDLDLDGEDEEDMGFDDVASSDFEYRGMVHNYSHVESGEDVPSFLQHNGYAEDSNTFLNKSELLDAPTEDTYSVLDLAAMEEQDMEEQEGEEEAALKAEYEEWVKEKELEALARKQEQEDYDVD